MTDIEDRRERRDRNRSRRDDQYLDHDSYQDYLALGGPDLGMDFQDYLRQLNRFYPTTNEENQNED